MTSSQKWKNKKGFVAAKLLVALFVIATAVLIFLAVRKNDNENSSTVLERTVKEDGRLVLDDNKSDKEDSCNFKTEEEKFAYNIHEIKDVARSYFTVDRMPKKDGEKIKMLLDEMQQKKLLLGIYDNEGNKCDSTKSYVEITKEKDEYVMKIYLSCSNIEDYIIVHIGCYDFCSEKPCEQEEKKEYEYEYKKEIACKLSDWSKWSNWSTKKESVNANKKEEVKEEIKKQEVVDVVDATQTNIVYNCNKYDGYTLNGNVCEKTVEVTNTYDASKNPVSYNCNQYPGYELKGDKCIKQITNTITIAANKKYSCQAGYTLNGDKCTKVVTKEERIPATAVYKTKNIEISYACNEQKCTTKTVMKCLDGCEMVPETSCETVPKTCTGTRQEKYISGYSCPNGYSNNGSECVKKISDTVVVDANISYACQEGYTLNGKNCTKKEIVNDVHDASLNTITYNCNQYSGATISGNKCIVKEYKTHKLKADYTGGNYICTSGYTLVGTKCQKTIVKDVKVKYYRYATRSCTGGSKDIKWSGSNDTSLLQDGYKKTGNKRVKVYK